jgi:hypothetical protein
VEFYLGGHVRKFIFNFSVLSALFGAVGLVKSTTRGPRDWRLILLWVAWGINVAIAVGTVAEQASDRELEEW